MRFKKKQVVRYTLTLLVLYFFLMVSSASAVNIVLVGEDNENLNDAFTQADAADTNAGSATTLQVKVPPANYKIFIMFNLSSIPSDATITNATYSDRVHNTESEYVEGIYHVFSSTSWEEDVITHNNARCDTGFDNAGECNLTQMDSKAW